MIINKYRRDVCAECVVDHNASEAFIFLKASSKKQLCVAFFYNST